LTSPVITPLGDSAVTLTFGNEISRTLSDHVVSAAAMIAKIPIAGVSDIVPSYGTLTVHYDPLTISYADLRRTLTSLQAASDSQPDTALSRRTHVIHVIYDGEDLDEVAHRCGISADDVIGIHSSAEYRVFVIGFVPGFAYLGPLDTRLVLPRRESPRKRVPAGSVAIAEGQTGIYPSVTPGGWHLIGHTNARMFDVNQSPPALLSVGDIVKFEPLNEP
jgi:KipI family sensor histidine kinase inhibitor